MYTNYRRNTKHLQWQSNYLRFVLAVNLPTKQITKNKLYNSVKNRRPCSHMYTKWKRNWMKIFIWQLNVQSSFWIEFQTIGKTIIVNRCANLSQIFIHVVWQMTKLIQQVEMNTCFFFFFYSLITKQTAMIVW